jgi:uncharacterized membrane protein YebE (DUF533 family)
MPSGRAESGRAAATGGSKPMSFGNIIGQILQQGMGGQTQTRDRLETTAQNLDRSGGGLESIFGQLSNALGRAGIDTAGAGQTASGFADKARDFMGQKQVGGLSGAQLGGIGAVAGALLGGGLGGAARGGAMAVLGTLALGALKRAQGQGDAAAPAEPEAQEIRELTAPDSERTVLKAMINAAKADGDIDAEEKARILARLEPSDDEAHRFLELEIAKPIDTASIVDAVKTPEQAAEIYAASLLAIRVDTPAERSYLTTLARDLKLSPDVVRRLHEMTGVPV